jgi:hypothetical protein
VRNAILDDWFAQDRGDDLQLAAAVRAVFQVDLGGAGRRLQLTIDVEQAG